jgi:cysteinyl-tRNA synthetase
LQQVYGGTHVTYARNITDVDDKIINRAERDGVDIGTLTATTGAQFQQDMLALGCLNPTVEPRATDHIPQMVAMIERLVDGGHAYPDGDGHVLFSVNSWDSYGRLANRSTKEMVAGARVEIATNKQDPMDFVLWKPSSGDQPGWDSPWGKGRPGWHIECSAMSKEHLGDVFDIHGGGLDLIFPHHQNEVAQSCCDHGGAMFGDRQDFAKVWMHNGYLQVEGRKMSKSEGNFLVVHDLLDQWPGEVLRLQMLMTHYRQPLDWTERRLEEAADTLHKWNGLTRDVAIDDLGEQSLPPQLLEPLSDDLNTPGAIAVLHELAKSGTSRELAAALSFLGFDSLVGQEWTAVRTEVDKDQIDELVAARVKARTTKDWAEADRIRDELVALNVVLKDAKDPASGEIVTTWEVKR